MVTDTTHVPINNCKCVLVQIFGFSATILASSSRQFWYYTGRPLGTTFRFLPESAHKAVPEIVIFIVFTQKH